MVIKHKYLLDPLFIFSLALYSVNKWIITPYELLTCKFCNYYLNDILLVLVMMPIILFFPRFFKVRDFHSPPLILEIIVPLIIWSIAFEYIGPFYFGRGTSDPVDIFAYFLGGFTGWIIWNRKKISAWFNTPPHSPVSLHASECSPPPPPSPSPPAHHWHHPP